jgi:hypothetical protein
MSVEDELEVLRLAVNRADDEHLGDVRSMEPPLLKILDLVRSHPAKQKFFEEQFVRMATGTFYHRLSWFRFACVN